MTDSIGGGFLKNMVDDIVASRFEDREVEAGRWVKELLKYPDKRPALDRGPGECPWHKKIFQMCKWHGTPWNVKQGKCGKWPRYL